MPGSEKDRESLHVIYQQICNRLAAIDDFRAKLLGLLPLVSGTGIFLLVGQGPSEDGLLQNGDVPLFPIGLFGFAITIGLFMYELRGIQRCNALKEAGAVIEDLLTRTYGQHNVCLPPAAKIVGATSAALVIYPTVLAAWAYVAFFDDVRISLGDVSFLLSPLWSALVVFVGFFAASLLLLPDLEFRAQRGDHARLAEVLDRFLTRISADPETAQSIARLKERLENVAKWDCKTER